MRQARRKRSRHYDDCCGNNVDCGALVVDGPVCGGGGGSTSGIETPPRRSSGFFQRGVEKGAEESRGGQWPQAAEKRRERGDGRKGTENRMAWRWKRSRATDRTRETRWGPAGRPAGQCCSTCAIEINVHGPRPRGVLLGTSSYLGRNNFNYSHYFKNYTFQLLRIWSFGRQHLRNEFFFTSVNIQANFFLSFVKYAKYLIQRANFGFRTYQ